MSYYYVKVPSAAGGRISAIWDGKVISNAKWSVKDAAAGANHKVYRCVDAPNNVDFCVSVNDNQANYSIIQLWENWDSGAHSGIGDSIQTSGANEIRAYASAGTHLCFNDHRVMWGTSYKFLMCYIGELKRFDTTKKMPILISRTTGTNYYNPLGYHSNTDSQVCMRCLWDQNGLVNQPLRRFGYSATYFYTRTCNGSWYFFETTMHDNDSPYLAMGYLDGVCSMYSTNNGFADGLMLQCGDARWLVMGGFYSTRCWAAMRLI